MTEPASSARDDWRQRQQEHGNVPRAVLMRGAPELLNDTIDAWHREILRMVLGNMATPTGNLYVLDVGAGFGRLANEIEAFGRMPIGVDYTPRFCAGFADLHGAAACGDLTALPFRDHAFSGAYCVTSLMYLDNDAARRSVEEIDRCVQPGGWVLLLEPCREFNDVARVLRPGKRRQKLAVPGFSREEFYRLVPHGWSMAGAGQCRWLTLALPLLVIATRWPMLYRIIHSVVLRLDRPRLGAPRRRARIAMYRWAVFRKST